MNAKLAVDIKTKGSGSIFQGTGKGVFAFRDWGFPEYNLPANKKAKPGVAGKARATDLQARGTGQPTKISSSQQKTLSFADAAARVLEEAGDSKPMHCLAISEKARERGYLQSSGKTPEATLYSVVLTEIDRHTQQGNTPRFVKHGKGLKSGHGGICMPSRLNQAAEPAGSTVGIVLQRRFGGRLSAEESRDDGPGSG